MKFLASFFEFFIMPYLTSVFIFLLYFEFINIDRGLIILLAKHLLYVVSIPLFILGIITIFIKNSDSLRFLMLLFFIISAIWFAYSENIINSFAKVYYTVIVSTGIFFLLYSIKRDSLSLNGLFSGQIIAIETIFSGVFSVYSFWLIFISMFFLGIINILYVKYLDANSHKLIHNFIIGLLSSILVGITIINYF